MKPSPASAPTKVQLIAFPYAGGSSGCYRKLGQALPHGVTFITYEPPGHGSRIREPLRTRLSAVVDDAIHCLDESFECPFAFYGHSYGAWLARDITRRLIALGRPVPVYLFVSGRRAPLSSASGPLLHQLPSPSLRDHLIDWGGIPQAVLADAELMALFERMLRADFEALETRQQEPVAPLDVPIHVMLGLDDAITDEQARGWQLETLRPLSLQYFSGNHFFIREHSSAVAKVIGQRLLGVVNCSEVAQVD